MGYFRSKVDGKGFSVLSFDVLESTSIKAKEIAASQTKPWTVVLAREQRAGYGRKGNAWYSPIGGLYFSLVLPKSNVADLQILTILAAFCVAKTIKDLYDVQPFIKLPNDVYLDGRKVCGILTENLIAGDVKASVMGIGINTNVSKFPAELAPNAVSLNEVLKKAVDNEAILEQIITHLQEIFNSISQ